MHIYTRTHIYTLYMYVWVYTLSDAGLLLKTLWQKQTLLMMNNFLLLPHCFLLVKPSFLRDFKIFAQSRLLHNCCIWERFIRRFAFIKRDRNKGKSLFCWFPILLFKEHKMKVKLFFISLHHRFNMKLTVLYKTSREISTYALLFWNLFESSVG